MDDDFDYDELLRLAESAPEVSAVVCRDRESAEVLVNWINENFPNER